MIKIAYFFRHPKDGISIGRVFQIIDREVIKHYSTEKIYMEKPGASICQIIRNLILVYKRRNKNGINHITGANHYLSLVLPSKLTITTVHDLGMIANPQNNLFKRIMLNLLLAQTLRFNYCIVCISEVTKNALLKYISFDDNRIKIIPDPIAQSFNYSPKIFNMKCPTVLHIGTKSHKNLERSIEALRGLSVKMRIIGKLTSELETKLTESSISYTNAWDLRDEEIMNEYLNCDIVNFPSTFEGFGMPIIEAQAIGRVCITSDMEPMRTIANGGAYLVDPYDVNSIREAYLHVMSSENIRNELIFKGLKNSEKYKASVVAEQYEALYRDILRSNT